MISSIYENSITFIAFKKSTFFSFMVDKILQICYLIVNTNSVKNIKADIAS